MKIANAPLGLLIPSLVSACKPPTPPAPISFEEIKPGDSVLVDFDSRGCFHHKQFRLRFEADSYGIVRVSSADPEKQSKAPIPLMASDLKSLNLLLAVYRNVRKGGCTTIDTVVVTKFESGRPVTVEKYIDETCDLSNRIQMPTFSTYWEASNGK